MTGEVRRDLLLAIPSTVLLVAADRFPQVYQPPLYGLVVLVAALTAWPFRAAYPHRLGFLRKADGGLTAANYFMFFTALSMLVTSVMGWLIYSD